MKKMNVLSVLTTLLLLLPVLVTAQTRDELVRTDREQLENDAAWFYDDLESGFQAAQASGKPLMVVLRCIP